MSVSGSLQFARQPIAGATNPLIDSVGAAAENLADLTMGKFLPHRQAEQFLVLRAQSGQGIKDSLVLGASHHHRFWARCRVSGEAAEPGDQATETPLRAEPVGENTTSDPVEPAERPLIGRNGVDATPGNKEGLGGTLPRRFLIDASPAIDVDLPVIAIEEPLKLLFGSG